MKDRIALTLTLAALFIPGRTSRSGHPPPRCSPFQKRPHLGHRRPRNPACARPVPVGDDPHEVIASADGRTAYISNYGCGAFHTLTVIDLVAQKP